MHDAPQHRPRPLPLLLHILRSEAGDDPERTADVLRGIRAYRSARRAPHHGRPAPYARAGRATLHDHGGDGPPVVLIPSLINGADILDLDADRSLVRWLAGQGFRPLLVDWGTPTASEAGLGIGDHVEQLLLPLLATLPEPPVLIGYCLGGTMATAAATLVPTRALGLIATPWRFSGYPPETRALMQRLWADARPAAERIGLLPMEVLQAAFWQIDPVRTLDKFAAFGRACEDPAAVTKFVPVEDWANDGAPLTHAAGHDLFETMLREDATGGNRWRVGGRTIDPAKLDMPILEIVSTTDRIVPAGAAADVGTRVETGLGHVGMIVGGARGAIRQSLSDWLGTV